MQLSALSAEEQLWFTKVPKANGIGTGAYYIILDRSKIIWLEIVAKRLLHLVTSCLNQLTFHLPCLRVSHYNLEAQRKILVIVGHVVSVHSQIEYPVKPLCKLVSSERLKLLTLGCKV